MSPPRDIADRADCERLVRAFYGRVMTDPIIGFIFTDVAHMDLEEHVPVITDFWETILLGAGSYRVDDRSGSMHGKKFLVREVLFGSDGTNLYVRLDFHPGHEQAIHRSADYWLLRPFNFRLLDRCGQLVLEDRGQLR